jgi:hypothetical protein
MCPGSSGLRLRVPVLLPDFHPWVAQAGKFGSHQYEQRAAATERFSDPPDQVSSCRPMCIAKPAAVAPH